MSLYLQNNTQSVTVDVGYVNVITVNYKKSSPERYALTNEGAILDSDNWVESEGSPVISGDTIVVDGLYEINTNIAVTSNSFTISGSFKAIDSIEVGGNTLDFTQGSIAGAVGSTGLNVSLSGFSQESEAFEGSAIIGVGVAPVDAAMAINEVLEISNTYNKSAKQVSDAITKVDQVEVKADSALQQVATAQTDATKGIDDAAVAKTVADSALQKANDVDVKADNAQSDATQALSDAGAAQITAGSANTKSDAIIAKNPAATVATVAAAIAAVDNGTASVGDLIDTEQYSGSTGLGGNRYIVRKNASRPTEDGGSVIYCAGDRYLEGLFVDGLMSPNRYGADGTKVGDSAAVQAMIDSGITLIELECREQTYKISGCTSLTEPVTIVGKPSKYGDRPTIDADSTVLTVGSLAGQKVNGFQTFSGFDVRVKADITGGIFDMRSCRNFVFDETVQITSDQQYFIGSVIRSNRSYQFRASCRHFAKGFALVEFGDETGGEVLDNISVRGSITHGNVVMQQRSGIVNCHNIDADNTKVREFANSDEGIKANTGVTYLDGAVSAGATSITVDDASQLKQGNLGANDLIYIGAGFDAEYVRVSSVSGNVITLDTPTRFAHSGNHNSSGKGQPVIFGAVFFTLDDVRGFTSNILHIESGFIGLHLRNMNGSVLGHIASTCRHMIVNDAGGDGNVVNSVSGGDAGWPVDISMMTMLECSAQGAFNPWIISSYPDISASFVTQEDLTGGDLAFWTHENSEVYSMTRASGTTTAPAHARIVNIEMTGNTNEIDIQDGVYYKQPLTLSINQNNQGFRIVFAFSASVSLVDTWRPSMSPYVADKIHLEWDGSVWNEVGRSGRVNTSPIFSTGNSSMSTASNNLNTYLKERGLMVLSATNGKVYMATGSAPTDAWTALDGSGDLTPA